MLPQGFNVLEICAFILDFNEEMRLFIMITILVIIYSHITELCVQYNTDLTECNCTDFAL